jgi:hypothetical protein
MKRAIKITAAAFAAFLTMAGTALASRAPTSGETRAFHSIMERKLPNDSQRWSGERVSTVNSRWAILHDVYELESEPIHRVTVILYEISRNTWEFYMMSNSSELGCGSEPTPSSRTRHDLGLAQCLAPKESGAPIAERTMTAAEAEQYCKAHGAVGSPAALWVPAQNGIGDEWVCSDTTNGEAPQ